MRYFYTLVALLALTATSWACPPAVAFTSGACYATQQVQVQTVAYAVPTVSYALVVPQVQQVQVQAAYAAPALLPSVGYGSAAIGYSSAGVVGNYGVGAVGYGAVGFNQIAFVRTRGVFVGHGFGGVNVAVGGGFFGGVHRGLFGGNRAVVRGAGEVSMFRKLLCFLGWHAEGFAGNHIPAYWTRATHGLWQCRHCWHQRWHMYRWYYRMLRARRAACGLAGLRGLTGGKDDPDRQ